MTATPKPRPMVAPVKKTGALSDAQSKKQPYRNQPLRHNMQLADLKTALLKEGESNAQ